MKTAVAVRCANTAIGAPVRSIEEDPEQFAGGGFERFGEMDEGLFMPFVVA